MLYFITCLYLFIWKWEKNLKWCYFFNFQAILVKFGPAQWSLGGPKLGKKYQKFQQISDTKYWGYVRKSVWFGAKKISLEMGGDECSHYARIIFFQKRNGSETKFSPTFTHLQRKSSFKMEILAPFSLAILSGK